MEAEQPPRGGARRMALPASQRLCITGLSLADPASAAGQSHVAVWAEVGGAAITIGMLWTERPIVAVEPMLLAGAFVLRHDSARSSVRVYGHYLDSPNPDGGEGQGQPTRRHFLEHIDVDQEPELFEYEPLSEEDHAERYDSDDGEQEEHPPRKARDGDAAGESSSSKRKNIALVDAPAGIVMPDRMSPWPAWFATVKNTAGIMRVSSSAAGDDIVTGSQEEAKERDIVVLYRYTRFSRARSGVEACRRTKLHWFRFAVPPAGDMERSLAWAGASLGPLIYPALFRRELRELWSSLAALATKTTNMIPPQASRIQVVVDVGILRREDHTAERMERVRGALEDSMGEAWPEHFHVGMELRLPEPVQGEEGRHEEDDARAAKRRKVAAVAEGEECSLCLDPLESGLTAWPGCSHVFHGECVEETLAGSATCPLCRHHLSDALVS